MANEVITIITPTTGSLKLLNAMESVQNQIYPHIRHWLIVDGSRWGEQFDSTYNKWMNEKRFQKHSFSRINSIPIQIIRLPDNTGESGFYGHRIYAAFSHLVNSEFVFFLDEDCYYDRYHVSSLVAMIEQQKLDWGYSLRTIIDATTGEVIPDNCESLGKWDVWGQHNVKLVDTSSYAFRKDFIQKTGHLWHWGWGGDRRYLGLITTVLKHTNFDTTGMHTCVYTLDGNPNSPTKDFFIKGNSWMANKYSSIISIKSAGSTISATDYPWHANRLKYST